MKCTCSKCNMLRRKVKSTATWKAEHARHGGIETGKTIQGPGYKVYSLVCKCGAIHYYLA